MNYLAGSTVPPVVWCHHVDDVIIQQRRPVTEKKTPIEERMLIATFCHTVDNVRIKKFQIVTTSTHTCIILCQLSSTSQFRCNLRKSMCFTPYKVVHNHHDYYYNYVTEHVRKQTYITFVVERSES